MPHSVKQLKQALVFDCVPDGLCVEQKSDSATAFQKSVEVLRQGTVIRDDIDVLRHPWFAVNHRRQTSGEMKPIACRSKIATALASAFPVSIGNIGEFPVDQSDHGSVSTVEPLGDFPFQPLGRQRSQF